MKTAEEPGDANRSTQQPQATSRTNRSAGVPLVSPGDPALASHYTHAAGQLPRSRVRVALLRAVPLFLRLQTAAGRQFTIQAGGETRCLTGCGIRSRAREPGYERPHYRDLHAQRDAERASRPETACALVARKNVPLAPRRGAFVR